jgi:hypothetical protein
VAEGCETAAPFSSPAMDTDTMSDTDTDIDLADIVSTALVCARQSQGDFTAGQVVTGRVLQALSQHGRLRLTTAQCVQAMHALKDIDSDVLVAAVQFMTRNMPSDITYPGVMNLLRRAAMLGIDGMAELHQARQRPKLLGPAARARARAAQERKISARKLIRALYERRRSFGPGWAFDFIEASYALPPDTWVSHDQLKALMELCEEAKIDWQRL